MNKVRAPRRRWESRCVPGWDSWGADEQRRMQEQKLHEYVNGQIYSFHPYYRRVFDESGIDPKSIRKIEDLKRIPFTYKEDIAPSREDPDAPRRFVLEPGFEHVKLHSGQGWVPVFSPGTERETAHGTEQEFSEEYRPIVTMFTTGRTAEPTPFFSTLRDLDRMREAGRRLGSVVSSLTAEGSDSRLVAVNNFPGVAHLAYWMSVTGAEGCASTMVSTGGTAGGNERILNIVELIRPTMFMGLPGYSYDLLKTAAAEGRDLSSLEMVVLGADRVTPGAREKIASLLEEMGAVDPVVTGAYGCTEMKYAWGDCGDDDIWYHTCPDMEIIEVVDPVSGDTLGEGETGELVITNLDARGSAVLRYRTGDILIGGYTTQRCPNCGRTMPRISGNITRRQVVKEFALSKVKGNLVDLNAFSIILDNNVDVLEWQVEIRSRNDDPEDIDEVLIYVCPTSIGEVSGLAERIVEEVRTSLEFKPDQVSLLSYDELSDRLSREGQPKKQRLTDLRE